MDAYLEIAVPLQTKAVTFFFGTGLSKFLTDGVAPSWLELIEDLTKNIDGSRRTLRNNLFKGNLWGQGIYGVRLND